MSAVLERYLPYQAVTPCLELIRTYGVHLKIVDTRVTRHGDYRTLPDGSHQITVNAMGNKYRFLITLVHEIAHLLAFERFGRQIKPHGVEWKRTFQHLMLPFLRPEVFPPGLLPLLAAHFKNPRASSSTDTALSLALREFDPEPMERHCVYELPEGSAFRLYNGRIFRKGPRKVKRYQCQEISTGKWYLFQPQAEVEWIPKGHL